MSDLAPQVSVIMPMHDAAQYLEESIGSVLAQSMPDLELLVVDDRSSDESASIAASFAGRDPRVRLMQVTGGYGAAAARNTGLAVARGRFVAFLDADDGWFEHKLERQLEFMRKSNAYFSYTAYEKVDASGSRKMRHVNVPSIQDHGDLLKGCPIGCSTVIVDTARTGSLVMPLMKRSQDYALWLELLRRYGPAQGLSEILGFYREHGGSLSSNKLSKLMAAWRIYRRYEGLSAWRATGCLAAYASHGLRKRFI